MNKKQKTKKTSLRLAHWKGSLCLVFLLELRMHPQEFLALVHHADEAAGKGSGGLRQG
jgi:hypothetical protein